MGGKTSNVGPGRVTLHSVDTDKKSHDQISHHPIEAPSGEMTDFTVGRNEETK